MATYKFATVTTTDATVTQVYLLTLPASSTIGFEVWVLGFRPDNGNSFVGIIRGGINNAAGGATLLGSTTQQWQSAAWPGLSAAAAANGRLQIRVQGIALTTITWTPSRVILTSLSTPFQTV